MILHRNNQLGLTFIVLALTPVFVLFFLIIANANLNILKVY